MKEIYAQLNSFRQSPRKFRLVADSIRGKRIEDAKNILAFLTKKGSSPLSKLLESAIANAKSQNIETKDLRVKSIEVNGGKILYRRRPAAHGAAHPIRKRTSHVKIVLSEKAQKIKKEISKE